ncbi:hypothetical protein ACFSKL_22015 [Belliella marina]|uniref:Uncharacterized protein n=1 Tax=Belliella marina TaxID=1644146 RepID=A0ABW4VUQ1_9BACT
MPLHRDLIYIDDKDVTDQVKHFRYAGGKCHVVFKTGDKEYAYSKDRAVITKTALSEDGTFQIFQYLKEIAEAIGLKNDRAESILAKSYGSIAQIPNDSILSNRQPQPVKCGYFQHEGCFRNKNNLEWIDMNRCVSWGQSGDAYNREKREIPTPNLSQPVPSYGRTVSQIWKKASAATGQNMILTPTHFESSYYEVSYRKIKRALPIWHFSGTIPS